VGYESHNVLISVFYVNGGAYCKGMLIGTGALIEEMALNKNGGAYWNEVCS